MIKYKSIVDISNTDISITFENSMCMITCSWVIHTGKKYTLELDFKKYTAEFNSVLILLEFTFYLQKFSSSVQNQELIF